MGKGKVKISGWVDVELHVQEGRRGNVRRLFCMKYLEELLLGKNSIVNL